MVRYHLVIRNDGVIPARATTSIANICRALLEQHSLELPFCLAGVPDRAKKS